MTTPKQERIEVAPLPEITLGYLVREALDEVDGNVEKAASRVYYQLINDKALLKKLIEHTVKLAVAGRTASTNCDRRRSVIQAVERQNSKPKDSKARVVALAQGISSCLLDMPLAGGLKLRNASAPELRQTIERYEKCAGNMMHKARWLRLILQSLPEGLHVGTIITEERAVELFEVAKQKQEPTV
jgi:hypothetical protein